MPQVSTWQVPKSYAWRQVFVNEKNEVLETSEEVDWGYEDLKGTSASRPRPSASGRPSRSACVLAQIRSAHVIYLHWTHSRAVSTLNPKP